MLRHPILTLVLGSLFTRIVDLALFAMVAWRDGVSVARLLRAWDGEWQYRAITEGWPESLPTNADGGIEPSTWAWPPLFPLLIRVLSAPFGRDFISPSMIAINLLASVLAAIALWAALRVTAGNRLALISALLWTSMPASPVFLMAYAEGMFMLLLFIALLLAGRGRLAAAGMVLVAAGLTKSSVAPYAIALIVVAAWGLLRLRKRERVGQRQWDCVFAIGLSVLAIVIWPVIVGIQLGAVNAYALVQQPWSRSSIPAWDTMQLLWNAGTRPYEDPLMAFVLVLVSLVAGFAILRDSRFPLMVRLVGVISPLFLVTIGAGTSTARLLLPDVGLPAWLARWVNFRIHVVVATFAICLALLLARWLWIAHYVSISTAVPPP